MTKTHQQTIIEYMAKNEIPKAYEPQKVEDNIYKQWESAGIFAPDKTKSGKP